MKSTKSPIRVALVEQHPIFRTTLSQTLKRDAGFDISIEVETGLQLFEALQRQSTEVIILDMSIAVMNGFETFRRLTMEYPFIPIIIHSVSFDDILTRRIRSIGARYFAEKGTKVEELVRLVWEVV